MAYVANLTAGDRIYVSNRGEQTKITASLINSSQQQNQSYSLSTGKWVVPPTLFKVRDAAILRIEAVGGEFFLQLQYGSITVLAATPDLFNAEILPLMMESESESIPGTLEMPPMQPMKPMSPMKMEMGNMKMEMGASRSTPAKAKFCSQCGASVKNSDRFCSQCGNSLS